MSNISRTGHVIRIEKHTLDLLTVIKKNIGIPKYKLIDIAVNFYYEQNKDYQKIINANYEIELAKKKLNDLLEEQKKCLNQLT
tara:strand:- start:799 stop:1047 length:249 start_codon:yes stop_codon:yes gene_type:complete